MSAAAANTFAELSFFPHLALFRHCVRFDLEGKLSVHDILTELEVRHHRSRLLARCAGQRHQFTVHRVCLPLTWRPTINIVTRDGSRRPQRCTDWDNACLLALFVFPNCPAAVQSRINQQFRLAPLTLVTSPLDESSVLALFRAVLPLQVLPQFRVGRFRIDFYFPALKLAVECDEYGHAHYSRQAERLRQDFITAELGCRWLRFDPYQAGFSPHALLRSVLAVWQTCAQTWETVPEQSSCE